MLENKTALITGASRGIGKAIATVFAQHGAFVGINYVQNKKEAETTLDLVKEAGSDGILLQGDISRREDVKIIVETLVDKRGSIDILVNNAGIYKRNSFSQLPKETWKKIMTVNLTGCYNTCKEVIPCMEPNSKIIFVSSQLAFKGSSHGADYAASKAGMLGLMRSLALELAEQSITVNAVAPGTIDTDMIGDYSQKRREQRMKEIPLGRLGHPRDVANACLFLASDLSNYITGETINVNGGLYIH